MTSGQARTAGNAAKWALVGVLAVVLTGVIAWQFVGSTRRTTSSETAASATDKNAEKPSRRLPRRETAKGVSLTPPLVTTTKWPVIPLAEVIAHDPFAPETLPGTEEKNSDNSASDADLAAQQQRAVMLAETLEALRDRGVNMVLQTSAGPVATIGDRMIKVGDKVGDYRVAEIDADGVVLEAAGPK